MSERALTVNGIPGRPVRAVHSGWAQAVDEAYDFARAEDLSGMRELLVGFVGDFVERLRKIELSDRDWQSAAFDCSLIAGTALALKEKIQAEHPPEPERR